MYRSLEQTHLTNFDAHSLATSFVSEFVEPPAVVTADMMVAVTATDLGSPDNVVRSRRAGDFIRPEHVAEWYDLDEARKVLGI